MTAELLTRPNVPALDEILGKVFPVLDHGFIRCIDYMGDQGAIVQAARVSYGKGTETPSGDRALIRYLMRHRHSTPLEMLEIKLHVKLPVFVARQWIRHRTANVNEYSARYSVMEREFYVPAPQDLAPQSTSNKQGRTGSYSDGDAARIRSNMEFSADRAFDLYERMIDQDEDGDNLSRELARVVLPLSTYTEWYWKVDLHNLLHFLSLRADPHAQKEIRVYADIICSIVKDWLPDVWEAFVDYRMQAVTFSRQEVEMIRSLLQDKVELGIAKVPGLSSREQTAFELAVGIEQLE